MSLTVGMVGHIVFGGAGIISGFSAFATNKGSPNHVLIGRTYGISMLLMAATGFYYAYIRTVHITMFAALLTVYLVLTSWLAARRRYQQPWVSRYLPPLTGLPIVAYGLYLTWNAIHGITDDFGHFQVPAIKYYEFFLVALIAFMFDVAAGLGKKQTPKQRIDQHIWRMAFTLYVACSSFFEGQAKVFPETLQYTIWLSLPEKFVLILMCYWLFKEKASRLLRIPITSVFTKK